MKIDLLQLKEKLKTLSGDDFDFEVANYLLTIKFDKKTPILVLVCNECQFYFRA